MHGACANAWRKNGGRYVQDICEVFGFQEATDLRVNSNT